MALRGRILVRPAKDASMRSKKRSLASRAEAREPVVPDHDPSAAPAVAGLARLLRVKNAEESMLRLGEVLERSTVLFRNSPDFAIPEVKFSQIDDGRLPFYVTRQVNRRGVIVVRGVVPPDDARRWRDSLLEYLERNGVIDGPPGARDVFWSRAQAQAREHLGVREVLSALSRLWKPDPSIPADLTKTLTFCDRAFVGSPACSSTTGRRAPVMAGGPSASQRWLSRHHSKAYRDIFEGRWEDYDPFRAGPRMQAAQAVSQDASGRGPPQPFRPFQGYLSLGRWGEKGNVYVVPMMRVATAFTLLRPFMPDVIEADTADGDDWLCGAREGSELVLSPKWHQPILNALVRLPPLSPGDAVFWHPDVVHCEAASMVAKNSKSRNAAFAVGGGRVRGRGDEDGPGRPELTTFAGLQLSCLPICEANSAYLKAQRTSLAEGSAPPAFTVAGEGEAGFHGRMSGDELTRWGKREMGLWWYLREHHNPALETHHRVLDIPYEW